jgi:hypothetical protein
MPLAVAAARLRRCGPGSLERQRDAILPQSTEDILPQPASVRKGRLCFGRKFLYVLKRTNYEMYLAPSCPGLNASLEDDHELHFGIDDFTWRIRC